MNIRSWPVTVIVALLFLAMNRASIGQMDPRVKAIPKELTLRFEGGLSPAYFAEVVAALARSELLDFVLHLDADGSTPAEILSKTGRLVGGKVPPVLDHYLCGINAHACVSPRSSGANRIVWRNTKAPPGASVPEEATCPDRHLPTYVLCLPSLRVYSYTTSAIVPYDSKRERLDEIVVGRTAGCAKFDDRCIRIIRSLNHSTQSGQDPISRNFAGKLRVPIKAYRVTFEIFSPRQLDQITRTIDEVVAKLSREGSVARQSNIHYTVAFLPPEPQHHSVAEPPAKPEELVGYIEPLRAMDYPYLSGKEFPWQRAVPVAVGVWDLRVDSEHCDFQVNGASAIVLPQPLELDKDDPPMPSRAKECGPTRRISSGKYDHATHIAGIIAARFNEHGIAGVNPKAKIWAYEITGSRLERDGDPILKAVEKLGSIHVVNISQSLKVEQYQSQLERLLDDEDGYQDTTLFVAAAGNDGKEVRSGSVGCPAVPACWSDDAVTGRAIVSVVALNGKGSDLLRDSVSGRPASNYGLAFDVAAIGESISTLHGNAFGSMPGTSVATPYVTGLASLIYARAPNLRLAPKDVKQRILYTVDFSDTLDGLVRFGRINFRRALEFSSDILNKKKDMCTADADCNIKSRFLREGNIRVIEGLQEGEPISNETFSVKDIRRIVAEDDSADSYYWVVVAKEGRLRKIRKARIDPNAVLKYRREGAIRQVTLNTVKDYTACSFVRGCN